MRNDVGGHDRTAAARRRRRAKFSLVPGISPEFSGGHFPRAAKQASAQAHDAVLLSLNARPSVAAAETAALWDLDNSWSNGQSDRKYDSVESAVDAVMAMLERS